MMRGRGFDDLQGRERQRDAVAEREGRHDCQQSREAAAEEQQADDEEDVVGPDGDVMDARCREGREHSEQALARSGEEVHARAVAASRISCRISCVAFVHVDEGLVIGVVGEEVRARWSACRSSRSPGRATAFRSRPARRPA